MAKKQYKYLPLVGAKLVGRRHDRDVDPPGMKELKNAFVSKSDSAITARPDFDPISESLTAYSASIEFPDGANQDDYLNSSFGLLGSGRQVFLSTYGQFDNGGDSLTSVYATGTASVTSGSRVVTGSDTLWNSEVWPGCTIEFEESGALYVIDDILSDTDLRITDNATATHSAVSYEIRTCHNPSNSNYKFNVQNFSNGIIYSCPTLDSPPSKKDISGPFYSRVQTTTTATTDTYLWGKSETYASDLQTWFGPRGTASWSNSGMRLAQNDASSATEVLKSINIFNPTLWTPVLGAPADFTFSTDSADIKWGTISGTIKYVVGGQKTSTGEPAVAYTSDLGTNWSVLTFTGQPSSTITRIESRSGSMWWFADSNNTVYFSSDGLATWSVCTGLGGMTGAITAIRAGKLAYEADDLVGQTAPGTNTAVLILTNVGEIYYAIYDTQVSDFADFTKKTVNLAHTPGGTWVDMAHKSYFEVVNGGTYTLTRFWEAWCFIYNNAAGTGTKPVAHLSTAYIINSTGGTSYPYAKNIDDPYLNYYGQNNATVVYYCVIKNDCDDGYDKFYIAGRTISTNKAFVIKNVFDDPVATNNNLVRQSIQTESGSATTIINQGPCGGNRIYLSVSAPSSDNPNSYIIDYSAETTYETTTNVTPFAPLSKTIRALTHSVLDGYVVIMATYEYSTQNEKWEYHPRRIRWTTPLTYDDFTSIGSGSAELDGSGVLLDSRSVNGRIVVFESSAIGAISPRGYATDPWEYDRIKDNIRSVSNPVVVDDMCYFIDDSGLLRATNGISVESPPFSFDLTEYDDFNANKPVWLTYSPELESLCIYNPSDENGHIYFVETEQGTVTRFQVPALDLGGASTERPKSVVCVENSADRRMMVSYNPDGSDDGDSAKLLVAELSTGDAITGADEWTAIADDDTYHNVDVQTPRVFIVPEGNKTGIKHLIVNTYTDGTSEATNPILVVQCKSLEDTAWHDNGDRNGTITVTNAACTGAGTAWSSTIGASGGTVYDTPCLATQARVYVGSAPQTLGTQYTITDTKEITFGSATGDTVYAYWENQPEVVANAGDMIQTTEGWHRVSSFDTASTATLDHYLSAAYFAANGSDATATHHHGTAFPVGEGQIKIGISKLVEGVKLRFLIFHRADGDATVTKITGVSVGHIPAGEKIVEP